LRDPSAVKHREALLRPLIRRAFSFKFKKLRELSQDRAD
jgi:hypothetical protein